VSAFVIVFAYVTLLAMESNSLDTECDAEEKAVAYIWGTELFRLVPSFLLERWTLANETCRV
jgi:hypothetical protein